MIVYVLVFAALAVFLAACWAVYTWAMKAGDPFGSENNPGQAPLGTMPPEIAHEPLRRSIHELPPLGDAVWHQLPLTSPAGPDDGTLNLHGPKAFDPERGFYDFREHRWEHETSPAERPAPPVCPGTGAGGQGTAAAAGDLRPPESPPPLHPPDLNQMAHIAAVAPELVPFGAWENDDFVHAVNTIRGGA